MGIKHNYQSGAANSGTSEVSSTRWNEDHVVDTDILLPLATPAAPAADKVSLSGKKIAGRMMVNQMGPSGQGATFQPHLGGNKVALWIPPGNATTVPGVFGMSVLTIIGTATARNVATTNVLTRMTRLGILSAATAGSLAGGREVAPKFTLGAGVNLGGFFYRCRFGVSDAAAVAGARMFVGLAASVAAPTNVEPSTLVNCIGVAQLSTSNNLQIVFGAASAGTPIDLGADFPANNPAIAYELALFAPPAGNVQYQVTRLDTGAIASGEITSGLPLNSTLLCHQIWRTNNATALAVGLDICSIYMETDI